ncbi:MAG: RMD1 family protein, partial [Rhabdochlamydiaceae bacterium]
FYTQVKNRAAAYCTATSYRTKEVVSHFRGKYTTSLFRDIVHIDFSGKDAFFFPYGAVVFWAFSAEEESDIIAQIKQYEEGSADTYEKEEMLFSFGDQQAIIEEEIILPGDDLQYRLAISHGLAQSVKLAAFESIIQKLISSTRHIPEQLSVKGKVPLSKREIRKKMGELFVERASINLHLDILDVPEYFWEHSEIEPLYRMIATHLDLGPRLQVLNQRLDIVHDLFEMLGNELNHQHSSKLEWIIIWLIVIEVLISIIHEVA